MCSASAVCPLPLISFSRSFTCYTNTISYSALSVAHNLSLMISLSFRCKTLNWIRYLDSKTGFTVSGPWRKQYHYQLILLGRSTFYLRSYSAHKAPKKNEGTWMSVSLTLKFYNFLAFSAWLCVSSKAISSVGVTPPWDPCLVIALATPAGKLELRKLGSGSLTAGVLLEKWLLNL